MSKKNSRRQELACSEPFWQFIERQPLDDGINGDFIVYAAADLKNYNIRTRRELDAYVAWSGGSRALRKAARRFWTRYRAEAAP